MVAISTGYILEQVRSLSEAEGVEAIEVAIVHAQARGSPFTVLDFATLNLVSSLSRKPLLLRTQKKVVVAELPRIIDLGVRGLIIDPCVLVGPEEAYRDEVASFSARRDSAE